MTESENDPLRGLLSEFALGPAWARQGSQSSQPRYRDTEDRPRRESRDRGAGGQRDGRRNFRGRDDARGGGRPPEAPPAKGVRVTIGPDQQAVHLVGREVHQVARVYPLFDIARILLAERARCRALFESEADGPTLFRGKLDESLFLSREDALRHFWQSEWRSDVVEEETVDAEPPAGNFQAVARCGMSGEWLGPPNYHAYQSNLRRLHRERFANMPFEVYASRVRTERGEEAVAAWLETMKHKTRWRLKDAGEDAEWIEDRGEIERAIAGTCFDRLFEETRRADVSAAIPARHLSPPLLTTLKLAGSHARKHPALLIPAICRALEAEHLPVFKRQGKLHTGPARPHALAKDTVLAERPAAMVEWIRNNKPATLAGLWKAVLPEGTTEPTPDYAADLFWLLQQGHILLYTDDTLVLQEPREPAPAPKAKEPKKPKPEKPVTPSPDTPEPIRDPNQQPDFMPVDRSSDTKRDVTPGPPLPGPEMLGEAAGLSQDPSAGLDVETEERNIAASSDLEELSPEEQALKVESVLPAEPAGSGSEEATRELAEEEAGNFRPENAPDLPPPAPEDREELR